MSAGPTQALLPFSVPVGSWAEHAVNFLLDHYDAPFQHFSAALYAMIAALQGALLAVPAPLMIGLLGLLAGWSAGLRAGLFAIGGLLLAHNMGLWHSTVTTLGLVVSAEVLVLVVGLPLGILAARSDLVDRGLRPMLDLMQTMPAFVYLIPAVMLFGLGLVPGVISTFIFSIPPLIRLTNLGIRQVPADLVEASEAFGATWLQTLAKVQLPVALPSIMAGVNQSIMLGLSMVVIAAMIGSGGLGKEVLEGITRLQVGSGFEAGLAVVILAIVLDRITQGIGVRKRRRR
ncbi:MAG: glycine/betaine ABC transporter [Chromatiales bacterium 21-64-14]|nr:MAG: glycine/betaine ABC transporter [Chromatiales bacterium 21-64-14]HQU14502.1 proline/glycine betaine ABC transporter permease [Gammaproteobacteria bacterium]